MLTILFNFSKTSAIHFFKSSINKLSQMNVKCFCIYFLLIGLQYYDKQDIFHDFLKSCNDLKVIKNMWSTLNVEIFRPTQKIISVFKYLPKSVHWPYVFHKTDLSLGSFTSNQRSRTKITKTFKTPKTCFVFIIM